MSKIYENNYYQTQKKNIHIKLKYCTKVENE